MNLANRSRNFFDIDRLILPGKSGLLVGYNEAEDGGDGDLSRDLCQTKHKKVGPAVSHQSYLGVVPE